jgi:hypothetical protein
LLETRYKKLLSIGRDSGISAAAGQAKIKTIETLFPKAKSIPAEV